MTRLLLALALLLHVHSTLAQKTPEDTPKTCRDGIDNDFDGAEDCEESTCWSADEECDRLLPGPIAVNDRPPIVFDVRMVTADGQTPSSDLLVVDIDGGGPNRDDVIAGRRGSASLFMNQPADGKLSLPQHPASIDTVSGRSRLASGDLNGDARADFIAVNDAGIHRFLGDGRGGFRRFPARALAPDSANGLPAISGPTIAVAKTRLRLYDARCRMRPAGFPDGEAFNADDLCASVDLPGTEDASRAIAFRSSNGLEYVATINDRRTVSLFEIVLTRRTMVNVPLTAIDAVSRGTFTAAGVVNDLAFTPDGDVLIFALNDGRVQAVIVSAAGAMEPNTTRFPTITLVPRTNGTPALDPFSHIAVGRLIEGQPAIAVAETKTANLYILPFTAAEGWNRRNLYATTFDAGGDKPTAGAVAMAELNNDGLLDVAVLDRESGNVIILRQQPAPCATYITSGSHGLMPTASLDRVPLLDELANKSYSPLARFNHLLAREVERINAKRRPANGFRDNADAEKAICPIRFIDVRGHWEKLSGEGTIIAYGGRAGWLTSMYVPAPMCWFPIPALPAFTPVDYWISAIFLLLPNLPGDPDPACVADLPLPSDPGTRLRFLVGGIGYGLELIGRAGASQGSRKAANQVNARVRDAIEDADSGMDKCTGQIFVDLIGHSRGTTVVTEALRRGFGKRSTYNFEVSTTLLDAVDPSPKDNIRPWIRAGYIVGDPPIRRVGSEWNSAFWCDDSSGSQLDLGVFAAPPLASEFWLPLLPPFPSREEAAEFKRAEIIGLPKGHERQRELERRARTFGSYGGPMTGLRHGDFAGDGLTPETDGIGLMWVDPDIEEDDEPGAHFLTAPSPAAAVDSGRFAFKFTSHLGRLIGNERADIASVGFHRSPDFNETDEAHCLPREPDCGHIPGECSGVIEDRDGIEAARRDSDGVVTRELVSDFDFRIHGGLVRNSIEIITDDPRFKKLTADTQTGGLYAFVTTSAQAQWAETGAWRRSGDVRLVTRAERLPAAFQRLTGPRTGDRVAWQQELFGPGTNAASHTDATLALSQAVARMHDTTVMARYPSSNASLSTELRAASITYPQLYVRIEYALRSRTNGTVTVSLRGPGVSQRTTWTAAEGITRHIGELLVNRNGVFREGEDTIRIEGKDVDVFSVSVRPFLPQRSRVTGADYEFVTLDYGVTLETARALSERSAFRGRRGRLARIGTSALREELTAKFQPETEGWSEGATFGQTLPAATLRGKRLGYWIEYPAP